jgi:hypothetical protein
MKQHIYATQKNNNKKQKTNKTKQYEKSKMKYIAGRKKYLKICLSSSFSTQMPSSLEKDEFSSILLSSEANRVLVILALPSRWL